MKRSLRDESEAVKAASNGLQDRWKTGVRSELDGAELEKECPRAATWETKASLQQAWCDLLEGTCLAGEGGRV